MNDRTMAFFAGLAALAWLPGLAQAQTWIDGAGLAVAVSPKSVKEAPAVGGGARFFVVGSEDAFIRLTGETLVGARPTRSGVALEHGTQFQFGIAPYVSVGKAWPHFGGAVQGDFDGVGAGPEHQSARVLMAVAEAGKHTFFDGGAVAVTGHGGVAHVHGGWGGDAPAAQRGFGKVVPAVGGSVVAQLGRQRDPGSVTLKGSATSFAGDGFRSDASLDVTLSRRWQARGGIRQTSLTAPSGKPVNVVQPYVQAVWGPVGRGN